MTMTACLLTRAASSNDAHIIHQLYVHNPEYFSIIAIDPPQEDEVRVELETATKDHRRHSELVLAMPEDTSRGLTTGIIDPLTCREVLGYLDYKVNYPNVNDATINLLLISKEVQSSGLGSRVAQDLERRLSGRARRMLASIYGQNERAKQFWQALGYRFAVDAKPILDWYAKSI